MKTFNNIQDILNEKNKQRDNKVIYTLLNVIIGELDRLPTRENPTADQIYTVINKMYNNAKEMSSYNEQSKTEELYLKDFIKQQFTEEELTNILIDLKNNGCKNIGEFMKELNTKYKGQFDGKTASKLIISILK